MADWFETRFRDVGASERVDPGFAAQVRALLVDEWGTPSRLRDPGPGADDFDSDLELEEIIMLETEDRPATGGPDEPRRRMPTRWLLAAAAVVVVAVTAALLVQPGDDETDTATVDPAPPAQQVPEIDDFLPLEPGWWFVDPDGDPSTPLRVNFEVAAEGWESWLGTVKFADDGHSVLTVMEVSNLVQEGCTDHAPADPPVGPTVDDLATALTELAPFEVTKQPRNVTVQGYRGKHLQLTVPDIPVVSARGGRQFEGCQGGQLQSWFSPIHDGGRAAFFGYNEEPGRTEDFWILDVDGTRLVLVTMSSPDSPPADVAELEAIFDSIQIVP